MMYNAISFGTYTSEKEGEDNQVCKPTIYIHWYGKCSQIFEYKKFQEIITIVFEQETVYKFS